MYSLYESINIEMLLKSSLLNVDKKALLIFHLIENINDVKTNVIRE